MKKPFYSILAASFLFTSCASEGNNAPETTESHSEIKKEVKAEVINGEATVTITTTENGKTTTEVLTGEEAEAYMEEDPMESTEIPEGAEVFIKKLDHDVNVDVDIESILNDPAIADLDEATKEKIRIAVENGLEDMDIDVQVNESESGSSKLKTKVMVIEEGE